ncbi:hypothetical protein L6278_00525 [Candidatus Parcubacteria bacterium]|nr:hypothetical protein [Patescibacteria group bacterium]MBU4482265.1 hypothetical protein [Patescibacteria group bacterium]MCG2686604.1 hypothetical protein [Candidatus Parcubacteria bacterium]
MNLEKQFSKKHTPGLRDELAQQIKEKRHGYSSDWKEWNKSEDNFEDEKLNVESGKLKKDFVGRIFKTKEFMQKELLWKDLVGQRRKEEIEELKDTFKERLSDTLKLNSFFTNLLDKTDYAKEVIKDYIAVLKEHDRDISKEEILDKVSSRLLGDVMPSGTRKGDKSGFHVGVNDILSHYYGSEINYDIYFYYPAEVVAKNYYHDISLKAYPNARNSDWYNDQIIFTQGKGIPVDAGICCIPESIEVDKNTGSQYKLDENMKPILDSVTQNHIEFFREEGGEYGLFRKILDQLKDTKKDQKNKSEELQRVSEELKFKNYDIFLKFYENYRRTNGCDLERFYKQNQMIYIKPEKEKLVTSKEFWENYFNKNPDKKPNKIIYSGKFITYSHTDEKKEKVMDELSQKTQVSDIGDINAYQNYIIGIENDIKQTISDIYDEVCTKHSKTEER